ncbi:hypothetical protein [uncultured Dokdonia sp.]|uniref:hypothetical protein n=1 Tax=uncultured Dokdonia sp. TaxID=575653 RepID=UPI00261AD0F4|nr:hypothetical protein [uncultured Dokdonia sp.]
MLENQHISIPKKVETQDDLDFQFLRRTGINYIEQLGSKLWTDFNSHDSGITILEVLSYAITDLGMRMNLDTADILASNEATKGIQDQFIKASEILPAKPLTQIDYRKLIIDIGDGSMGEKLVKNCWIMPREQTLYVDCKTGDIAFDSAELQTDKLQIFNVKGLYDILIDYNDEIDDCGRSTVLSETLNRFHDNRNLCEDLIEIKEVPTQNIAVCTRIEVENNADEEWVHANVLKVINNYLAPDINFYSLNQLLEQGYATDEIFEGPILDNGFIKTEELLNSQLRREVRVSDLIKEIMSVEGVKVINEISINNCDGKVNLDDWVICVDYGKKPVLCDLSSFSYSKGTLPLNINDAQVKAFQQQIREEEALARENARLNKELVVPQGTVLNIENHTTILNDFPDTYGVGESGIIGKSSPEREALAKQLKGYLLFFDKMLASYFQHLGKVKELLSVNGSLKRTYFTQAIKGVKGFDELVNDYTTSDDDQLTDDLYKALDNSVERRNQILDHLIARFSEQFNEYTFLMKTLYGSASDEIIVNNKEAFLGAYKDISAERGLGYNYYAQPDSELWDTSNISGVQKRIARLLGIQNYDRRYVSDSPVVINSATSTDGDTTYTWKVKNAIGNIALSSVNTKELEYAALQEMYEAVFLSIQIDTEDLDIAFEQTLEDGDFVGNLKICVSGSGRYYFKVVKREVVDGVSTEEVIAVHNPTYITEEELKDVIRTLIAYFKFEFSEEGIFLVEHLLLKPRTALDYELLGIGCMDVDSSFIVASDVKTDVEPGSEEFMTSCEEECEKDAFDPYSYRVSIVLPGYTFRFSNPDFRKYAETLIREELPAHVLAKICWVGDRQDGTAAANDLYDFEKVYRKYLIDKSGEDLASLAESTRGLITAMNNLNNIYPPGRLLDCDQDSNDDLNGKIILGQSNI